jgi:GNAT superfamily N-acetyltransferase
MSYAVVGERLVGVDDANIYLAYGHNLAAGHGFVFYAGGERVEGFTSLAWTVVMAAAYRLAPAHPERLLFVASILLVAATWAVLIQFLRTAAGTARMHSLALGLFVGAWCLSTPSYGTWMTTSLMETSLWSPTVCCGAILFSRLIYTGDTRSVFVLGPVAVATHRQNQGIGQRLISHGIAVLRQEGVELAVTYGDPSFYRRVGFKAISQDDVPAPFPLQHPEGWLGQSLNNAPMTPLKGPSRCVPAFNDPAFW